jgi:hypothetical protein
MEEKKGKSVFSEKKEGRKDIQISDKKVKVRLHFR